MTLSTTTDGWDSLDNELARWLRVRATVRAAQDREASPLDGTAMALRRVRAALAFLASDDIGDDARMVALVSRAYRWSIRIARELVAIEHEALDGVAEWQRFEAFAPFALAFFDSVLGAPFAAAAKDGEVARLRREVDAVLAPMRAAMTSSALAA